MRHRVDIPRKWRLRARDFGHEMVAWYEARPRFKGAGTRDIPEDPVRQAMGKLGEIAMALFLGLDPETAVKLDVDALDRGHDIYGLPPDRRIDVKTIEERKNFLLWPRDLTDEYWTKNFNILVSVSAYSFSWCMIDGMIGKQEFFDKKQVADGRLVGLGLEPETWFVRKATLADAAPLRAGVVGLDWAGRFTHYCDCSKEAGFGFRRIAAQWPARDLVLQGSYAG